MKRGSRPQKLAAGAATPSTVLREEAMLTEDTTAEESTDTDIPNEDARTEQTCEVCGTTSDTVQTNRFMDLPIPPVDACTGCLPHVHQDPMTWFREEVQG
ncbi:MAG: hypothetical protein ACOCY1_00440 [Halovenus sp.]